MTYKELKEALDYMSEEGLSLDVLVDIGNDKFKPALLLTDIINVVSSQKMLEYLGFPGNQPVLLI